MATKSEKFDRDELEAWLNKQPVDVSLVIAARSALRVTPLLVRLTGSDGELRTDLLLPLFRAMALPWAAASYPAHGKEVLATATDDATAAATATDDATAAAAATAADAAAAAAYAAAAAAATAAYAATAAAATAATATDDAAATATDDAADAAAAAATAAYAATAAAATALRIDLAQLEAGLSPAEVAGHPLWPDNQIPDDIYKNWQELTSILLSAGPDWDIWTVWYEDRLHGRASKSAALEVARVTLPEPMREKGSELVNATLRKLTDLAAKGGDDAVWARLEELQQEYSKTGKPEKTLKTEGGSFEIEGGSAEFETFEPELPADEDNEAENVDVKAAEERLSTAKNVWLLQYNEGDRVSNWTREAVPGSTIRWKTGKALPRAMQAGDSVVYWRTTAKGGVVGTGHVLSTDVEDENGINRFPTEVREFNEDNLIPRKEAIEAAKIDRKNWRGAVLDLPADQAERLNHHLKEKGWLGFGPEANPNPGDTQEAKASADDAAAQRVQGEINMRRDDAERDHDALGRAPLAISLAWALHEIWCNEQGLNQRSGHEPQEEAPGFVAHVDAPWGGGKTSFANLIARTLNPNLDDKIPEFLKKRYPDRKDMSGLFLAAAHEKGGLVENDRAKYVRAARRPWIIVPYNAWLNQHVDPPWWSFYQTIRKTCFQSIRKEGCPEVVQKGDGSYENHKESWLNRFDRWRGLWVRELWWRLSTPKVVIQLSVTFVSVLIGYLLYQLGLVAEVKGKAAIVTTSGIGLVLALITGAGSFIGAAITVLADALAPGRNALGEKVALGSADPLKRFRTHFAKMMKAVERPVLVIIDDIDRCEPKFIVEMTRGLQTILKSPRVVYLLLGDRNWIEQAFEVCHEDMKSIDVGAEHTFGGRFVEKAIQLSFILPGITGKKEDYVREVLSGRSSGSSAARSVQTAQPELARLDIQKASLDSLLLDDADQAGVEKGSAAGSAEMSGRNTNMDENEEISDAALLRVRNEMSQAKTAKEISAVGAAQSKAFGGDRALKRAVREETVLRRSAQREEVEEAIRHWLQPLAKYLPGNPRHIKRIINAVFMYQNSLLLTEEDYDEADFGGDQWRQLVIGVVLMVGYPNSWSLLTHHPDWVEPLSAGLESLPSEGTTANSSAFAEYQSLSRNKNFVELLSKTELRDTSGEVQQTLITEDTVRWLNELIPLNGR